MALFALDPQTTVVASDDLLADRQAQAQMITFTGGAIMGAVESLENFGLLVGWNTDTGVADADPSLIFKQLGAHRDCAAGRSRLDCVFDQVVQHLADPLAVEYTIRQVVVGLVDQCQAVLLGLQAQPR